VAERRNFRGIVFDLDGTLIDSYEAIATSLNHARQAFGKPPMSIGEVRLQVGHGLESLIESWVDSEQVDRGVELFREKYTEVYSQATRLLPQVAATVENLLQLEIPMAVASNKPARFTAPILQGFGLDAAFKAILGPDTVGSTKPDPAMLTAAVAALALPREEVVYVGDMVLDVESADRAGLEVILLTGGSSTVEALRATGRTVLRHFSLIPSYLDSGAR